MEFVGGGGAIALGLELEGGVGDRDREVLAQAILQLGEDCGGIFHGEVFVNYHVGHQNRHAGGHRAGVEVMHSKHMRHVFQMFAYLIEVKSIRCFLQQHLDRVVQQLDGARNHHQCDDGTGHGVEAIPSGGDHYQGRGHHGHRAKCVIHHLEERGLHIHVVFALRGKDENRDDICGKTQNAREQQQADIVDFRFGTAEQTHAGLHQRIDANDEQHHGTCGSGEHLKPGPAPSTSVVGLAAHQYGGDCGCRQHGHVGEHMTGIHQQGQ